MADHTDIEWADATWNPLAGCSVVSPGCGDCYAMRRVAPRLAANPATPHYAGTVKKTKTGYVWTGKIGVAADSVLLKPLSWSKPHLIFVNSTSDLFHPNVPDEVIDRIFAVMMLADRHTFQILTKRPERMRDYVLDLPVRASKVVQAAIVLGILDPRLASFFEAVPQIALRNVWLGASIEDEQHSDERRQPMWRISQKGWTTFVSYEPALGPVSWAGWEFLDQVISGGETGSRAHPSHPDWHRAARDFCAENDIAYFFKQWGNWIAVLDRDREDPDWRADYSGEFNQARKGIAWLNLAGGAGFHGERFHIMRSVKKSDAGRLLDGVEHNAFPTTPQREEAR